MTLARRDGLRWGVTIEAGTMMRFPGTLLSTQLCTACGNMVVNNVADEIHPKSINIQHGSENNRGPHSLTRQILELAIPALGALVAEPLFTVCDSAMVGHLGVHALAGLGVGSTVLQTIVGVFVFLAYSTTALAARALGEGHQDQAVRSGIQAMWLAFGLGVIATAILAWLAPFIVVWMGGTAEVLPDAVAYLRASCPGLIGMFVVLAATGTLRGLLNTRIPLYVSAGGALFNVVANAVLIYGCDWGVAGSGAGTALAQTLMAAVLVTVVVRGARRLEVSLKPSWGQVARAAWEGAPLLVRTVALRAALLLTTTVATTIGVAGLASHQVVWTIWTFAAFLLDALAIAAQALVGFALGTGDTRQLRALITKLVWWGAGLGVALGVVLAAGAWALPWVFGSDPTMHSIATAALLIAALFMPLGGVVYQLDGILIGANKTRFMAVSSLITLVLYAPALGWLTHLIESAGQVPLPPSAQRHWMVALWVCFGLVFMGVRGLTLAWRTWFSPRAAVVRGQ